MYVAGDIGGGARDLSVAVDAGRIGAAAAERSEVGDCIRRLGLGIRATDPRHDSNGERKRKDADVPHSASLSSPLRGKRQQRSSRKEFATRRRKFQLPAQWNVAAPR